MKSLARVALCSVALSVAALSGIRSADAACSSGGTVSNVNDCVPVGKSSKDCFLEWSLTPVPPPDPSSGFPTAKIECLDNDPTCDNDITPGQCTFLVGACVNVVDGRFPCTPTDAGSYILKKPSEKDGMKPHKNPFNRANRRGLDLGLGGIVPTAATNVCSSEAAFVVPLKKGIKTGKGKIKVQLLDGALQKDSDTLKLACVPNPAIATIPCASARQITLASELIGGQLAMGRVGDWLIENDKARFIIRDAGRDFSFMLTYGGHVIDADLQRKMGPTSLAPPYPPGRDAFLAMTPLINISSTDNPDPLNPTAIVVINDGSAGGAAVLRTEGPDDLFDPIDPRLAIKGFSVSLSVPPSAIDNNLPLDIVNEYTLNCGDDFLQIETIINNTGGTALDLYIGDYANGGGQLEIVGPGLGFGEAAIRLGGSVGAGEQTYDFIGFLGFGEAAQVSYGLIPQMYDLTSSFAQSGVVVPIYGQNLVGILFAPDISKPPGILNVPAGDSNSFMRWFAVGDNGMGRILDARHALAARGDITPAVATGYVNGTVRVGGVPVDGCRVSIVRQPGNRGAQSGLVDVFDTKDGGFYQGTLPKGDYVAEVKCPGYPYEGGGATPLEKPIKISSSTVVDFDVPATGLVRVTAADNLAAPLSAKVSVVGLESVSDPGIDETIFGTTHSLGNVFGYDAREKVTIYGLPQVHFAGPSGDTGFFPVPPGAYQIVVSHGPEYSVSKTSITVTAGSSQTVPATIVPVVDTTGFISSDYHVHLINSPDSTVSKTERIVTMLAEGVDYFVASDHDFLTDLSADVMAIAGASLLVKTAISDEITTFDSGHFGAYPLDLADPTSVTGGAVDWGRDGEPVGAGYPSDLSYDLSPDELVLLVKGPPYNATVVQANHFNSGTLGYFRVHGIDTTVVPPQSSTSPANLRLDPALTNTYTDELTALELWIENSRSQNALALGENMGDWFNMLNNFNSTDADHMKMRKTAVFNSDTHSRAVVQAGGPRNMVASLIDSPPLINITDVAVNLNDGRNIGTNGPFPRVTITGDAAAMAGHDLALPLLVPASLGVATVQVDIQSPDWARFDVVDIYVNTVPTCTFQCIGGTNAGASCTVASQCPGSGATCGVNFVGGSKKVCTATPTFTMPVTPSATVLGNGGTRLTGSVTKILTGGDLPAGDAWVVVVVRGRDGISAPLFPMAPQSILAKACSGDPCRSCTLNAQCTFVGTCTITNQTTAELGDGNFNQCGVTALAIANPLFIDRNADGFYKGVAIP